MLTGGWILTVSATMLNGMDRRPIQCCRSTGFGSLCRAWDNASPVEGVRATLEALVKPILDAADRCAGKAGA